VNSGQTRLLLRTRETCKWPNACEIITSICSLWYFNFQSNFVTLRSSISCSRNFWHPFLCFRGKQLRVDSKGELTSLVTHAMHFGMCKNTFQKFASQEAFYLCFDKGSLLVQGWGSFEVLRRIQVDCLLGKLCADFCSPVNLTYWCLSFHLVTLPVVDIWYSWYKVLSQGLLFTCPPHMFDSGSSPNTPKNGNCMTGVETE
jgi:hypothetical protein